MRIGSAREEPATARQKLIIARLCMALGVKDEMEQQPMTIGEAGRLIRELERRLRNRSTQWRRKSRS